MLYRFARALLPDGWNEKVEIEVDEVSGVITRVSPGEGANQAAFSGVGIPGFINSHSHAFQSAFAGLTEYKTDRTDSFWTWRNQMYQFLQALDPVRCYVIAKQLYQEMLSAGYTSVGEFHYVHRTPAGKRYESIAEMANAVVQAAIDTGISICILPVMYQRGGFDGRELEGAQCRFYLSEDEFFDLLANLKRQWTDYPQVDVGMAFHSLRAVDIPTIQRVAAQYSADYPQRPIHVHVAEQVAEVEECVAATGKRPIDLLLNSVDVDRKWCVIHATHMNSQETRALANSGATVCVCPTTEANLGDGVFEAESYLIEHGGSIAIGSDSHIAIDPPGELRMLEYSQRLTRRRRAILCTESRSTARYLCEATWEGGAQSLALPTGRLAVNHRADIVVLEQRTEGMAEGVDSPGAQSGGAHARALNSRLNRGRRHPDSELDYLVFRHTNQALATTIARGTGR